MRAEENRKAESMVFTNTRACTCFEDGCETRIQAGEGIGVFIPSRGKRYLCRDCASGVQRMGAYHSTANGGFEKVGTNKSGALESTCIGVEFEAVTRALNINDYTLKMYLRKMGANIESDCTVDFEAPSAIMEGLKTLSKALEYIERGGFLPCFNNERCGAHIHVTCDDISYIRRYYHSIFIPLSEYIEDMGSDKRIEVFGSDFRHWAQPIDIASHPTEHTNIFNTQHSHSLEFRLPRITGAKQYMRIARFWREIGYTINAYDLHKTATDNAERIRSARALGEELVQIARKYFE